MTYYSDTLCITAIPKTLIFATVVQKCPKLHYSAAPAHHGDTRATVHVKDGTGGGALM